MCTAISFVGKNHYFGRNLDLDYHYEEQVVVSPRQFPLAGMEQHPAIIGMATVVEGYPLYYDGTNEYGLSVAALHFPGNGFYHKAKPGKEAISSFDFIPYLLTRCKNSREAWELLQNAVVTEEAFSEGYPPTPLHWLIADRDMAFVAESTAEGLKLWENPVGVLTNNPPFDSMMGHLSLYRNLSAQEGENRLVPEIDLVPISGGTGGFGLPGDFSSPSRFVRAAFALHHKGQSEDISQFFHILSYVEQLDGCVQAKGRFHKTVYSSCCDTQRGIYYYCTYENRQITAVDMGKTDLCGRELTAFPLQWSQQIRWETK